MKSTNKSLFCEMTIKRSFLVSRTGLFIVAIFIFFSIVTCGNKDALYPEFWSAAAGGDLEKVEQLVDKGLDVNNRDLAGSTALIQAATEGHTKVVKYLISKGADVNVKEKSMNLSALSAAASRGHLDTVRILLDAGATDTANAYMYAEKYRRTQVMEMLRQTR